MTTSALPVSVSPTGLRYVHVAEEGRIGVLGCGTTMVEAFEAAAAGMFDLMADLDCLPRAPALQITTARGTPRGGRSDPVIEY